MDNNYSTPRNVFFSIFFFLISFLSFGQTQTYTYAPGTYNWTVPNCVTSITVKLWGAGGGGGNSNGTGGSGGGSGAYSTATIAVTPGTTISFTVGSGGDGGDAGTGTTVNNGSDGGDSSLTYGATTFTATGGKGGAGGAANSGTLGNGGTASGGDTNIDGEDGTSESSNGGKGGDAPYGGAGGATVTSPGNPGNTGSSPGGGGSGGYRTIGANMAGGSGGDGQFQLIFANDYCVPMFFNGGRPVTRVTFADIDNSSTNTITTDNRYSYDDYSCTVTGNVTAGETYSISVEGNTDGPYNHYVIVFIDWDQDGVLGNNANEITDLGSLYDTDGTDGKPVTGTITVPATAVNGDTRMRVMKTNEYSFSSNPCHYWWGWGEAEDYTINVTGGITYTTEKFEMPGTWSWTVPCDVSSIQVEVWGAGAAGGGSNNASTGGGGGGSGGYTYKTISVSSGTIFTATVGGGGVGAISDDGGNGESSGFTDGGTNVFIANGGSGGKSGGNGGAGGAGATAGSGGSMNTAGNSGVATSGTGTDVKGGDGGAAPSASRGGYGVSNGDGQTGFSPGSGGGGGDMGASDSFAGGNGGNGAVWITYVSSSANSLITDNTLTYDSAGVVNANAAEYSDLSMNAPSGYFSNVTFASYGTPTSSAPYSEGSCNSPVSLPVVQNYLLGNNSAVIPAGNSTFTDECYGTVKRLSVTAYYSLPVCPGTVTVYGSTPSGGSGGSYTYQWESSTISATSGFSAISGATSKDYTGVVNVSTWFRRVVTGCGTSNASKSGVVYVPITALATPTIGTITPASCGGTGSVELTGLPASGDIIQTGTVGNTIAITGGGTQTISGLALGTYQFAVDNGTCTSIASIDVVITEVSTPNIWNGSWSAGTPTTNHSVVFAADYNSSADLDACSVTVNSGVSVVFNSGHTLNVINEVIVDGTLTFENNASLVQTNDAALNFGSINYKRNTTPILKTDYTYWSSPVSSFTLGGITSGTLYYSFNASIDNWAAASSSTTMVKAKGYIVRGPNSYSTSTPAILPVTFVGVPNNGNVTITVGGDDTSNLIGNPYPSAIDADAFLNANSTVLEGTLYFWTHNTAIQLATNITNGSAGSGTYAYTSDDYAVYNLTGGVGTEAISGGGVIPSGKIAAGQGFMATGLSVGGDVVFDNSMRISGGASGTDNAQFFKQTSNSKKSAVTEKNRVWLNLANNQGAFKQLLVGYITGATNDYDRMYDGDNNNANEYINFYSINNDHKLTIQGRALPFDKTDLVSLGYESSIAGDFTIAIDKTDGLLSSQNVFIEDKLSGEIHDLKESAFTFTTETGTFENRFVLRYEDPAKIAVIETVDEKDTVAGGNLGVGDVSLTNITNTPLEVNGLLIWNANNEINIYSSDKTISDVYIYDSYGKLIYKGLSISSNEVKVKHLVVADNAFLIVKVVLKNGDTIAKKVVR